MINRNYIIRKKDDNNSNINESIYYEACENSFELAQFKKEEEKYKKELNNNTKNKTLFNLITKNKNENTLPIKKENIIPFKQNKIFNNSNIENKSSIYEDCEEQCDISFSENNTSLHKNNNKTINNKSQKSKEFSLNESNFKSE